MVADYEADDFAEFKKIHDLITNVEEIEFRDPPAMLISNSYLNPKVKPKKAESMWRTYKSPNSYA